MTALRESRKLRAAEEKVQWDLLAPKKVTGLGNFGLTTIYCVFNHRLWSEPNLSGESRAEKVMLFYFF